MPFHGYALPRVISLYVSKREQNHFSQSPPSRLRLKVKAAYTSEITAYSETPALKLSR